MQIWFRAFLVAQTNFIDLHVPSEIIVMSSGTSISLLEAQAATGRIIDPKNGERMSVHEASQKRVIDRQFETVLARSVWNLLIFKYIFSSNYHSSVFK